MVLASLCAHVLEFLIAVVFFNTVFSWKRKKFTTVLIGICSYAIVLLFYLLFDSTIVNIISAAIFYFIFAKIFYSCKISSSICSSLFLTVALTASEFIVMSLMSLVRKDGIENFNSSTLNLFILVFFSRLIYLIIVLSIGTCLQKDNMRKPPIFLFLSPIASTAIIYTLWIVSSEANVSRPMSYLIIITSFAIVASVLLTYIFYGKTTKELNDLYVNQSETQRIETDYEYYTILDKQNEQLKTILHDEKNHLAAIKSLANKPEVSKYIDEVYGQITENSLFGNTKNKILDLTINKYQHICDDKNIYFYTSIKTANLSYIENSDLITLLGNLLDNAVDAAKMTKERKIDLSLNRTNGFDVLTCTNSSDTKPKTVHGDLRTTKKGGGLHGLGIRSVRRIVKKYKGDFEWSYDNVNKEFTVYIAF